MLSSGNTAKRLEKFSKAYKKQNKQYFIEKTAYEAPRLPGEGKNNKFNLDV